MSCWSGVGAVLGGVGGFILGGPAGAAIGAGVLGSSGASVDAANANQNIAMAQMQMAQQVLAQQQQDRQTALGLAKPSMQELAMIQQQQQMGYQSLTGQLTALKGQEQLLNSVDPALRSAGEQAYQLLQGKQAAAVAPLQEQLSRQRAALQSNLRAQLGSGYETSSAGMAALSRFDNDAAMTTSQVQQQTLQSFLGLSASVRPNLQQGIQSAYSSSDAMYQSALAAQQNIQGREVAAYNQMAPNYQNVISTAGAPYIGQLGTANALGNIFSGAAGVGGIMLGNQLQGQQIAAAVPKGGGGFTYSPGSQVPTSYQSPNFGTIR